MVSHGLIDDTLSDDDFERVVKCLTLEDEDTSVCSGSFQLRSASASEACLNFLKTQCLRRIRESIVNSYAGSRDRRAAAFAGAFVAASIFEDVKTDGFNALGKLFSNGDQCSH